MNAHVSAVRRPIRALILSAGALTALSVQGVAHADELIVSAAASLTNAFRDVATAFEKTHPDTKVVLNLGASDILLQQIANGAPADVFASADETAMDKAVAQNDVVTGTRHDFATNSLVMIVPADSHLKVRSVRETVAMAEVKRVALGDPASVPVGRYTKAALEHEGSWDAVSAKAVLANNVRQALDYVARGEVDAGFVYGTDAAIMPQKVKVAMKVPTETPVAYPIAVVKGSAHAAEAEAFTGLVLSPQGQAILAKYGFEPPASH
ncbi:molybdate ABC transporter substrate-binding protein [Trinickia sp. NRRL B-1857]|uniref:molybdate ABC transporter substrate-binding protein n=1 Tax=Trinickia sp. NRRL B-1857 TaxID=3162879 RepID=UPI003D2C9A11